MTETPNDPTAAPDEQASDANPEEADQAVTAEGDATPVEQEVGDDGNE